MAEAQLANQLTRIESMTNADLRTELKQRGCPTSGNKKDLLIKLRIALQKEYEQNVQQSSMNQHHNPVAAQHPSQVNLIIPQIVHSSPTPMIHIPQQSPVVTHQQISSTNIPQINTTTVVSSTPEKRTRSRSKKPSIDAPSDEISTSTSAQELINNEPIILDTSIDDINLEVPSSASKSIDEKQNDIELIQEKPHRSSVGNNSVKSDATPEKIPLSNEPQRLNESTSQKQQNVPSITTDKVEKPIVHTENDKTKNDNKVVNQSPSVDLSANLKPTTTIKEQAVISKDESPSKTKEPEKTVPQEQIKPSRPPPASFVKSFNRSTSNKINLTSELLKTLISDISLAPESVINDELDALLNDDPIEFSANEPILETNIGNSNPMTIGELADQKHPSNRTVVMDVQIDSTSSNNDSMTKKKQNSTSTRISSMDLKTSFDGKANIADEPIRIKNATTVYEPSSEILYIRGLTRPFSLFQLKELLSRYGTLVDGEFWLDKIKSQCFVTYNTLEEAQNAREALDGCRWPSTNPKTLSVRFGRQDEFEFSKTHDLPPDQITSDSIDRIVQEQTNAISVPRSASPINGVKSSTKMNRSEGQEADVLKSQKGNRSGFLITDEEEDEEEPEIINAPPAKELDDYFRKTKAKPSIYWLPLSEEQIVERASRQEQRKAERDVEQRKRELDENVQRSDSNSRRRSVSPRDKRKRSSSPSRREFKRH